MLFMKGWKAAGALVSLKGITSHSKEPGAESGFPFITVRNMDKVIGMSEINGGVDMGFTRSGKEVRNERKRILILFGYFIEASKIYAEAEGFIFLESEDYQSTMGGGSLADKSGSEMVVKEVTENF